VLEAIARHGSFAAAAKALHRVPSAVSYTVGALEEALGVALFDRSGRRAVLTVAGHRVLAAGAGVLQAARDLDTLGETLAAGWEPAVQIVADGALPMAPILRSIRSFTEEGRPTRVRLDVEYQGGVAEVFARDEAALMLVLEPDGDAAHEVRDLPPFDMVLVAHRDHALAGVSADRAALQAHVELVVKDSSARFVANPRGSWFSSRHVLHLSDFHSKRLALLDRAGYGWMPRHMVEDALSDGTLVLLDAPGGATWTYRPALVSRGHAALGPAAQVLRARLLEAFGRTI
jgi:DNA-binding transcriptional LysR family regulator